MAWIASCVLSCTSATVGSPTGGKGGSVQGGRGGTASTGGAAGASEGGTGGGSSTFYFGQGGSGGRDDGSAGDAEPTGDCSESAKVVYLVTSQNDLFAFDPRISGLGAYRRIGILSCETESTPQSMSVDRVGTAYVFYSSGHLYYVDTTTAKCTATAYQHPVSPAKALYQLGMGFTAETPGASTQVLYIHSPDFGLATVDLRTLGVSKLNVLQSLTAELTGGPDAVLFDFCSDTSELSEVKRDSYQTRLVHKFNLGGITAFAFSRYAGVFYVFTAGSLGGMTRTTAFDPQKNTESVRDSDIGVTVVGAGQSTCVPPPPPIP